MGEHEENREERLMQPGDRLVHRRGLIDRGEARWLELLAQFDREQLWQLDGQLSCVHWLMWRLGFSRGTAFEKLRIAHELRRRPAVAEAFAAGDISYSAVRAITRLDRPDPAVDEALVNLAKIGTVRDLEQAIRRYQLCADQERAGTLAAAARRGIHIKRGVDGYSTAEITLEDTELDELLLALRAATDHATPRDDSAHDDCAAATQTQAVDESPQADCSPEDEAETAPAKGWKKAADALLDLIRTGLAYLGQGHVAGADRYMVHLIHHINTGETELADGTPLPQATADRIACDTSAVTHLLGSGGEPLALGRKTRQWSTAQHRAITVRDGGTCRFPGCTNRITDIHHLHHWTNGGPTNIENGLLLCQRHHTLTHEGHQATGDANHQVAFHRPDGTTLGTTRPRTPQDLRSPIVSGAPDADGF